MSRIYDEIREQMSLDSNADSNLQHIAHMLEGYRERILNDDPVCPYSIGSARYWSFKTGVQMAVGDLGTGRVVRLLSEK